MLSKILQGQLNNGYGGLINKLLKFKPRLRLPTHWCLQTYQLTRQSCTTVEILEYAKDKHDNNNYRHNRYVLPTILSVFGAAAIVQYFDNDCPNKAECSVSVPNKKAISREEVSKHTTKETGIWVIYGHNIYDITEFVEGHPGGKNYIMLAAGKNVEPYWEMYAFHKNEEVLEILKEYHIGQLQEKDWFMNSKRQGPFASDPLRHPALISNSNEPFNAETPPVLAVDKFITPNELFFVRNHLPVPDLTDKINTLVLQGPTIPKSVMMSVDELKKNYKKISLVAALQCAGNRRNEMNPIKKVKGLSWSHNAISNAEWSGALLKEVLLKAGVNPDDENVKHIHFEGADVDPTGAPYGASIPADRIFDQNLPVLIAYEMNGEPLPRDHGYPLRIIAPGIVGARNVKWLKRIIVSDKEYNGHWQQNDYKPFSPNIDWDNVNFHESPAIQELPVTSAICVPPEGSSIHEDEDEVLVKGYAYSGGGRGIIRVDVTVDGGKTWNTATLNQSRQGWNKMYSWTLWECSVPIPEEHNGKVEIMCRAVDNSCNTQPEHVAPIWNLRGVLNNAWHKAIVNVVTD